MSFKTGSALKKHRIKKKAFEAIDAMCEKVSRRGDADPFDVIQENAYNAVLSHPFCEAAMEARILEAVHVADIDAIRKSFAGVWECLSKPGVVAAARGLPLRRAVGAALAGPGVSYDAALKFSGGSWKKSGFLAAQKRRAAFMINEDPSEL